MLRKRKLIYALIFISLLLIIGNILIERFSEQDIVIVQEVSQKVIEEKFQSVLNDYGIIDSWISKKTPRRKIADSLDHIYKIKIPLDISIASLIKDINTNFLDLPVSIESVEKKNYSNSEIKISSNNFLKFSVNLVHDKKIKREYSEFSFVVKIDDKVNEEVLEKFSKIYFKYKVVFIPSEFSSEIMEELDCDYLVLLNNEIEDSRFLLDEDYSKQKLVNAIKEIIITFGRKAVYLIDKESRIYKSKIYNLIKDEFEKRGISILDLNTLTPLSAETAKQLNSLFGFYVTSLKGKDGKTFFLSYSDFLALAPQIEKQIKMGDRVTEVSFN
ncbi:MAG: hypothetical protein ABFS12_06600 [Bacteroidota bacterium]